ncbi:MAG: 8-amino-7-oxononanoate synthase [Deltaproteobacteria bacterium GWA2_54_12]|nr:MAG: 8-amino-7-oxononanoate synthase [Deltaproteobacteria bacterium GWA2_54_12]
MREEILEEISRLTALGLKRTLRLVEGPQGPRVTMDGQEVVLMCSNDYLGLANPPLVKEAAIKAIEKWGTGAGASRLVSGNMEAHHILEERIKEFKAAPSALLFNSGYNANMGLITALADRSTEVFSDRLNHASIVDACVLSRARVKRYPNRDTNALEKLLKASAAKKKLIITDSVFSMDGTIAPLPDIISLLERHGAMLVIDDAHATGVLGESGRGSLEHFRMEGHPSVIQMGTLGKALGSFGAFVTTEQEVIDLLISRARAFVYTTALPPSVCAAATKAIDIIDKDHGLIRKLWENTSTITQGLKEAGFDTMGSETPIIPVKIGDNHKVMDASRRLLEHGVFVQGIRPPTVPNGTSRLRVTVTAAHTGEDLKKALAAFRGIING